MNLEDTILVDYNDGDEVDMVAIAVVDDVLNVDSAGEVKTSVGPGDTLYVSLHLSSNVKLKEARLTHASATIESIGYQTRTLEEQWFFTGMVDTNITEFTTSVIPNAISLYFYGKQGSPTTSTQELGVITYSGEDYSNMPYIAKVTMSYTVQIFKVVMPDVYLATEDDTFPVGIVFYLEDA